MRHRTGYAVVAVTYTALQAFTTVPSPLYGNYARRDGLSPLMITLVYAAYAVGVSISLVFAGHLSDTLGRRPLLLAALGLDAISAVIFMTAPTLPGLFAARIVTGLAVGVTASTATAFLTELFLAHRPAALMHRAQLVSTSAALGGLGIGGLVAGLLAGYLGHPLELPYAVSLAVFAICGGLLFIAPETRPRATPLPRYRPQQLAVPPDSRREFAAALTGVAAQFAVYGLFVGLAGTFLAGVLHRSSLVLSGTVLFIVFAAGVGCAAVTVRLGRRALVALGVLLMIFGLALLVLSAWLPQPNLGVFIASGALIGAGGAALFKSSLGVAIAVSPRDRTAETLASFFLAGYLGLSVPVIGIGIALAHATVRASLLGFAIVIAVGVLAATPGLLAKQRN